MGDPTAPSRSSTALAGAGLDFQIPPHSSCQLHGKWYCVWGSAIADGLCFRNAAFTLLEVILGTVDRMPIGDHQWGIWFGKIPPFLERIISPILVASQAIQVVAICAIAGGSGFGTWDNLQGVTLVPGGDRIPSPYWVNTVVGIRAVSEHLRDLMKSFPSHADPGVVAIL